MLVQQMVDVVVVIDDSSSLSLLCVAKSAVFVH
jgi:hypothetical protein